MACVEKFKKMRVFIYLLVIPVLFLVFGCEEEQDFNTSCLLEEVQFDEFSSLRYITISGGQIYEVRQIFDDGEEVRTLETFRFEHYPDSLAIKRLSSPNMRLPYMHVLFENELPQKVVRFFPSEGVQLVHTFDYSDPTRIRITLDRIASTGDVLRAGYGDYFLDENGNVSRLNTFGIDQFNYGGDLVEYLDQSFTHDDFRNPVQGFFLPFFNPVALPDPRFFNNNNIISINDQNGSSIFYNHEYGLREETLRSTDSQGGFLEFTYINCN